MPAYIDTHAHYFDRKFATLDGGADALLSSPDFKAVIRAVINVGTSLESSRTAVEMAGKYPFIILGNPHESVRPAISGALAIENKSAIGILETFTAASAVVAADTAAKTALVELVEIRLAKGMCGKSYLIITGSVSSVTAAIERAKAGVEDGMLLDTSIIAGPDERLWESIL